MAEYERQGKWIPKQRNEQSKGGGYRITIVQKDEKKRVMNSLNFYLVDRFRNSIGSTSTSPLPPPIFLAQLSFAHLPDSG